MTTFIPLLAVQQRTHAVGYLMTVRQHGSAAEATAASYAARMRLRQAPAAIAPPRPAQIAVTPNASLACPQELVDDDKFLNMLVPCSWRFLLMLASVKHGFSTDRIVSPERTRDIVAARDEAMALIYQHTQSSMPQVGKMFHRDHTTVIHGLRKRGVTGKFVDLRETYNGGRPPPRQLQPAIIAVDVPAAVDELIEQNRQLRAYIALEPDREFAAAAATVFGISPMQCQILQMLMTGKVLTSEALLHGSSPNRDVSPNSLKVQLCKLRKRFSAHGVRFRSQYLIGYSMGAGDRQRVSSLLYEAAAQ